MYQTQTSFNKMKKYIKNIYQVNIDKKISFQLL